MTIFTAPEVIGHRGAGRGNVDGNVENTPESFRAAVDSGASWIEIDVRRTADDHLVLRHDEMLEDGRTIADLPVADLRDDGAITLEEAVGAIPPNIGLDIDVKTVMEDATDPEARRTMTLLLPVLRREARHRRMFVCSFDPAALLRLHREAPEIPTAWMPFVRNPLDQAVAGAAGLGCAIVAIDARSFGLTGEPARPGRREVDYTVGVAHRAGLEIVSWCPSPTDAARFADAGMDAVVVDDVPGVIEALKER
ncbi:glycerophosphoryl diester phosphodiesterase [Lipingzhangella halophila]|uniref:Glycerophosphoryl diester phosphodiesterase n=1 Tax=Lipingzhangella halophila TaxID=1783352 RepID=A0A7W7RL18_9ACTN|nr:glycerophosphodiester phosphodiesterase [Lipingzhangella halophila]MBB4933947.1 glycerophosphoryl diester phosphodiesterase [Lipingzhangella halophila]